MQNIPFFSDITTRINQYLEPLEGYKLFGNTGADYAMAFVLLVVMTLVFAVAQKIIIVRLDRLADRTNTDIDDTLIDIVQSVRPAFYSFASVYIAIKTLSLHELFFKGMTIIFVVWIAIQAVLALQKLIDYILSRKMKNEKDGSALDAYSYIGNIAKWLLWVFAALAVLANFGVNITSVLAGLGIMGIAVGFALQNILGDLFSSFAIYFDKPFQVGDLIVVGEHTGKVEHIGIKTTRIRALQGEEIVIPNQELTGARVQNFRKLKERRVAFSIGILYETPREKIEKVTKIITNIIEKVEKARLDRVHFSSFGDSALVFEIVYYVLSDAYLDKMNVQQEIQFEIMREFEKEKIEFAYPVVDVRLTQVVR